MHLSIILNHDIQNKTVDIRAQQEYCLRMARIRDAADVWGFTESELAYAPKVESMVYVLHFGKPYHHARHYIGIALDGDVNRRAFEHVTGEGSPLVKAVVDAGIEVTVSLIVAGDRRTERKMHNRHGPAVCPECKGGH